MRLVTLLLSLILLGSCERYQVKPCELDSCDDRRPTIFNAEEWAGTITYNNSINRWGVRTINFGNANGYKYCYFCIDVNDTFKVVDKPVVFSGHLKEACNIPSRPTVYDEIYYVKPTMLR